MPDPTNSTATTPAATEPSKPEVQKDVPASAGTEPTAMRDVRPKRQYSLYAEGSRIWGARQSKYKGVVTPENQDSTFTYTGKPDTQSEIVNGEAGIRRTKLVDNHRNTWTVGAVYKSLTVNTGNNLSIRQDIKTPVRNDAGQVISERMEMKEHTAFSPTAPELLNLRFYGLAMGVEKKIDNKNDPKAGFVMGANVAGGKMSSESPYAQSFPVTMNGVAPGTVPAIPKTNEWGGSVKAYLGMEDGTKWWRPGIMFSGQATASSSALLAEAEASLFKTIAFSKAEDAVRLKLKGGIGAMKAVVEHETGNATDKVEMLGQLTPFVQTTLTIPLGKPKVKR